MKRVYLADLQSNERLAFRTLPQNLKMQVVGEAVGWATALAQAPATRPDMPARQKDEQSTSYEYE